MFYETIMGFLELFKNKTEEDFMLQAEQAEKMGDYSKAIENYNKVIGTFFEGKSPDSYKHIIKKVVRCNIKLGNYEQVLELWRYQYSPSDYTPKEMYELIKIFEAANLPDLAMKVYEQAGDKLLRNKINFLINQKKIPEANLELTRLLGSLPDNTPGIIDLWMQKAKLSMSLKKFPDAHRYLAKILDKDSKNMEARKLNDFCRAQIRED